MNKIINKVLSFVLVVMLLCTTISGTLVFADVLTGQKVELTAPTGDINVGDTVEIPVTLSNPNSLNGAMVKVT